jgi:hypothetical protein
MFERLSYGGVMQIMKGKHKVVNQVAYTTGKALALAWLNEFAGDIPLKTEMWIYPDNFEDIEEEVVELIHPSTCVKITIHLDTEQDHD